MKTIKELLTILLSEYQAITPPNPLYSHTGFGFTRMVEGAVKKNQLTSEEKDYLLNYLTDNKPIGVTPFYWWPSREVTPRIEFINNLISKID